MINTSEFIHPEDAAAIKTIERIPGISKISKKILEYGYEKLFYGENMASHIKLSPTQLPHIYKYLPKICDELEMEEPEFYLEMNPAPNAYTFGDTYKYICVTSGLIEMMEDDEITAVIAHECGHILCRHTLYHTIARILLGNGVTNILSDSISEMVLLAFFYWQRKSELSCDRVASVITSPETVSRVMVRLSGGPKSITKDINLKEWMDQADKYDELCNDKGTWDRIIQTYNTLFLTHPFAAVRVREIIKWGNGPQYHTAKGLLRNLNVFRCSKCGKAVNNMYCEYCGTKI